MRAVQFPVLNEIALVDTAEPTPSADEVVVDLKAAALNHRDLWIKQGQYAGLKFPIIPGSDGAGTISALGGVNGNWQVGDAVVINPSFDWGADENAQSSNFSILGLPRSGTMAEKIAVPASQLAAKPAHLSWSEAAALPLAGLTAYRALFSRAHLHAGDRVLISGVGGGVALFALQYAVAIGAEVWVTSSSRAKIDQAITLGARGGFNYLDDGWTRKSSEEVGGFDVIVDSAGGAGFEGLVNASAPGARIVFFGATRGDPDSLPMRKIFWKQISLLGSTMGSPADWRSMVSFVDLHQIKPIVSDTFALENAAAAFDLMAEGGQFGKIALTIGA